MTVASVLGPIGNLADHATEYTRAGLEIFPVNPRDKTPLVSQYKATTDPDQIGEWWDRWPQALIGHRISPDHVILDIDPRHHGNDTWRALKAELGQLPATRAHASGRGDGGGHLWWMNPGIKLAIAPFDRWAEERGLGHEITDNDGNRHRWSCGIDLLHHKHRYTILPPSPHPDTHQPYTWIDSHGLHVPPAVMPQLLVDLTTDDTPPEPPKPPRDPDPDSIADWYSTHHRWSNLLPRHHWTLRGGDGDTDRARWRHPTATSAFSGTLKHGCLFVYTPNTPFEVTTPGDPHGYTLFRAWATLEHRGDMTAAARAARELKDGQRVNGNDLSWLPAPQVDPETGETTPRARPLVLTPASSIKLRKVKWCWDQRLALGTLGLLAGPEGLGKSTVAYTLAAAITRGDLPGEHHGTPKAVLVCATEDSWGHTIAPRLHAAGANLDLVYRAEIQLADDILVGLSLPLDILEVEHAARQVDAALLILDPLISRIEGNLDTHRDGDVRKALEPVASMADNTGLAILGLIHHNKSGSTDPLNVIMASKAFTAVSRSVHTVIRDPDDETGLRRYFGTPKNNLGRTDLPTLSFTITSWTYPTDEGEGSTGQLQWSTEHRESIADILARSARDPEEKSALDEAVQWLEDYLSERQMRARAGDVISAGKAAGHSERTVQRARKKLGIEKSKSGFQGAWMWSLPNMPSVGALAPLGDEETGSPNPPKATNPPQDPNLGALAPLGSPGHKGAKTLKGAKGVSPHAREAPLDDTRIDATTSDPDRTEQPNPGQLGPLDTDELF